MDVSEVKKWEFGEGGVGGGVNQGEEGGRAGGVPHGCMHDGVKHGGW